MPINYKESVSGDLSGEGAGEPFILGIGVNTITGTSRSNYGASPDWDRILVALGPNGHLENIKLGGYIETTQSGAWVISSSSFSVISNYGSFPGPTFYQGGLAFYDSGFFVGDRFNPPAKKNFFFDLNPEELLGGDSAFQQMIRVVAAGNSASCNGGPEYCSLDSIEGFVSADYTWTFTVTDSRLVAPPPIPEPETYALMLLGLAVVGSAARRPKSA